MTPTTETQTQTPAKPTNSIRLPDMNEVQMVGRLTKDATVRSYGENQKAANFTVAINRRIKGEKGEWKNKTVFIDAVAFGSVANYAEPRLTKGQAVMIEGRLNQHMYQTKEGAKQSIVKVEARRIQFLTKSAAKEAEAGREAE